MKRSKVIVAAIATIGFFLPLVGLSLNRQTQARGILETAKPDAVATVQHAEQSPEAHTYLYTSQAQWVWEGVMASLNTLPLMQRAIAASSALDATEVPTLAILNEPLKTTGLGPIRIGMALEEVDETGLELIPVEGSSNSECQYYRIEDHAEPIGLMAVEGRILRIDVWPGSLTTTLSGAKIGTTEKELVNYYGKDRLEATFNPNTEGKIIVFTPQDPGEDIYRLVFETDERGRVVQYRAGQFPSVTWPEGCL
jgi:hypothetical protein